MMNITVLANGAFPSVTSVSSCLALADMVVCCDGALENYLRWWRAQSPSSRCRVCVVGDGDSLRPSLLTEAAAAGLAVEHHPVAEQESNDLSKAVHFAVAQWRQGGGGGGALAIDILGATGLREDHTLANISLLAYYQERYPSVAFRLLSDFCAMRPMRGCCRFRSFPGQQVSLFSFTPEVPVSLRGLRYPLEGRRLRWLWEGSLNESLADSFEVEGGLLVVCQNWLV